MEAGLTVAKDPAPQAHDPLDPRAVAYLSGSARAERRSFEPGSSVAHLAAPHHHRKSGRAAQRRESQPAERSGRASGGRMEKALTKLGSFTISRKAKQELSAIGDDISVSARPSPPSLILSFSVSPFRAIGCSSLPAIALDPLFSIFILSCPAVLGKLRLEILLVAWLMAVLM